MSWLDRSQSPLPNWTRGCCGMNTTERWLGRIVYPDTNIFVNNRIETTVNYGVGCGYGYNSWGCGLFKNWKQAAVWGIGLGAAKTLLGCFLGTKNKVTPGSDTPETTTNPRRKAIDDLKAEVYAAIKAETKAAPITDGTKRVWKAQIDDIRNKYKNELTQDELDELQNLEDLIDGKDKTNHNENNDPDPNINNDPDPNINNDPDPNINNDPDPNINNDPDPTVDARTEEDKAIFGEDVKMKDLTTADLNTLLNGADFVELTNFDAVIDTSSEMSDFVTSDFNKTSDGVTKAQTIRQVFLSKDAESGNFKITVFLKGKATPLVYTMKASEDNVMVFGGSKNEGGTQEYQLREHDGKLCLIQYTGMTGHGTADVKNTGASATDEAQDKKIKEMFPDEE